MKRGDFIKNAALAGATLLAGQSVSANTKDDLKKVIRRDGWKITWEGEGADGFSTTHFKKKKLVEIGIAGVTGKVPVYYYIITTKEDGWLKVLFSNEYVEIPTADKAKTLFEGYIQSEKEYKTLMGFIRI